MQFLFKIYIEQKKKHSTNLARDEYKKRDIWKRGEENRKRRKKAEAFGAWVFRRNLWCKPTNFVHLLLQFSCQPWLMMDCLRIEGTLSNPQASSHSSSPSFLCSLPLSLFAVRYIKVWFQIRVTKMLFYVHLSSVVMFSLSRKQKENKRNFFYLHVFCSSRKPRTGNHDSIRETSGIRLSLMDRFPGFRQI